MAFIGNIYFERGSGASPNVYTRICEVFSLSGVGKTKALVDVTTFCSNGTREYIGGLADGQEITVEANYDCESTGIAAMIADVNATATVDYRVVVDCGSPVQNILFAGIPLSWVLNPSVDNKNTISFTVKISGDIAIG